MPYAPGISYDTQSFGNSLGNLGQNIQQGLKDYTQNKRLDATATGQIEAYLQQASQSGGVQLTPTSQKLAEKLTQGKATLNDKLTLLGTLQTEGKLREDEQQRQQREAATKLQMEQLKQAQVAGAADIEARNRLTQLNQYMGGAGRGVLAPQAQSRLQGMANDPMMANAAKVYAATGDVPKADTMLNIDSREQIAALRAQHAMELFNLKQEHAGGYSTQKEAVDAAKTAGAKSVTVQQNSQGRWLASATFDDGSKALKMDQGDLQRSIGLRARMGQLSNVITQIKAGNISYAGSAGKLPQLEAELKTMQAEFDKLTEKHLPTPKPQDAPEVGGFIVREIK